METKEQIKAILQDVTLFCRMDRGFALRGYQLAVAQAVCASVLQDQGLAFVVMFPRQSGKNELQAQIEAYLLFLLSRVGGEMVKISPTWKPQSLNAMRRLERVLRRNGAVEGLWQKESGYVYRLGQARIYFLSGGPEANIVGATASALLEVDEAQDVQIGKFDRDIAPMAASTNATRVFWGTAWTANTLLARELRGARAEQARDGVRRVFQLTADDVAAEVPAYGRFVAQQVARLGREHPSIKTQYFSEEIEGEGGMFPVERQALMRGMHAPQLAPRGAEETYALLVDVGGEDEGAASGNLSNPGRDSTALTVVRVDLETLADPLLRAPTYRVVDRRLWTGTRHAALYGELRALADHWRARRVVVDATGVGAGLASFLERALPGRVTAFVFSAASKSKLGWDFLAVCDSGRFREPQTGADAGQARFAALQELFWTQVRHCRSEPRVGPGRGLAWGVPDGTRLGGEVLHDDLLLSAALCAVLDGQNWYSGGGALIAPRPDPLEQMDREGF
jgi:hypothetical protein